MRGRLLDLYRAERKADERPGRGLGRHSVRRKATQAIPPPCAVWAAFVRASWEEVNEIVAAANVYTIKK